MATRLRREAVDERPVEEAADDRDDEDDEGPYEGQVGIGEVPERAGIAVAAEELGEAADQEPKGDCAEACADTNQQRQRRRHPTLAIERARRSRAPGELGAGGVGEMRDRPTDRA